MHLVQRVLKFCILSTFRNSIWRKTSLKKVCNPNTHRHKNVLKSYLMHNLLSKSHKITCKHVESFFLQSLHQVSSILNTYSYKKKMQKDSQDRVMGSEDFAYGSRFFFYIIYNFYGFSRGCFMITISHCCVKCGNNAVTQRARTICIIYYRVSSGIPIDEVG